MITLPAGTYYIGDLCYVITDDNWISLIKQLNVIKGDVTIPKPVVDMYNIWLHNTLNGDGLFQDESNNQYPVDSGTIGIVSSINFSSSTIDRVLDLNLGTIHMFTKQVKCSYTNGVFMFTDDVKTVIINTNIQVDEFETEDD